jgi:hypothetical protein
MEPVALWDIILCMSAGYKEPQCEEVNLSIILSEVGG